MVCQMRTPSHEPLARAIKSRNFSLDFVWGLLKLHMFDQSKNANHIWFNQQWFTIVYSRVSVTSIAQKPYFSSNAVWAFMIHIVCHVYRPKSKPFSFWLERYVVGSNIIRLVRFLKEVILFIVVINLSIHLLIWFIYSSFFFLFFCFG